jgi:hypothetical protein
MQCTLAAQVAFNLAARAIRSRLWLLQPKRWTRRRAHGTSAKTVERSLFRVRIRNPSLKLSAVTRNDIEFRLIAAQSIEGIICK